LRGWVVTMASCLAVLLAACASASAVGGKSSASRPGRAAARPVGVPTPSQTSAASPGEYLDVVDLSGPGLGLAGLGTDAAGGYARLVASANFGRSFTAIGPRTAAGTSADDVFFLGLQDGWFAVFNVITVGETLYRTTDGGRTWRGYAAPGHNMAAGSGDTVQFLTPDRGWLVSTSGSGPLEFLYSTADGGTSWRLVARLGTGTSHGPGILPELGQVRFEPGGQIGWLGGGVFSRALYRTGDGGRTWQQASIPAPAGAQFGLPAGSGQMLLEPVTLCTGALVLYRSTDGGTRWSQISTVPGTATATLGCPARPVPVSFPSSQVGWAAPVRAARMAIYRTTDGGRRWEKTAGNSPFPAGGGGLPVIQGIDATHAWLLTPGDQLYATVNGGATWRRIDTAAIAAGS
jgi:photosystem II stability/assembly factor-like uncharacterized protein